MAAPLDPLRVSGLAPLGVRSYRLLFTGLVLGQALLPLQFIAQIFWVQEHADPALAILLVGVIGTMRGAGVLSFGLFGGALADRFDRRHLLLAAQAGNLAVALAVTALFATGAGGALALSGFFALIFCNAALFAVDGPARLALVPDLLGPRLTPAGISLNTAGMQIAMPVSIFASGFLIDSLGFATTYGISALAHAIDLACLSRIRYRPSLPERGRAPDRGWRRAVRDVRHGIAYSRTQPTVFWTIALMVAIALGFPAVANLGPTWVTTVVGVSYRHFGLVAVTWGVGALLASLLLTRYSLYERKGALVVLSALGFAVSFGVFSGGTVPLAVVGNLGLGAAMAVSQIASVSLLQHVVPNEVRGRVMSLLGLNMGVAQLLTLPIAGVGQLLTLEVLFPALALLVLVLVVAITFADPALWRARVLRSELIDTVSAGEDSAEPAQARPAAGGG